MQKAQHTPGPWLYSGRIVRSTDGVVIADVGEGAEANGHLIAAAPSMKRELEAALSALESGDPRALDTCRSGIKSVLRLAAIAAATTHPT